MCAECHSTGVRKNYDAATDRFAHPFRRDQRRLRGLSRPGLGPCRLGAWAGKLVALRTGRRPDKGLVVGFDERHGVAWSAGLRTGLPERNVAPARLRKEVETCGLCHARRGGFSEDWVPGQWLSDTHVVSPLARGLYEADGQMRDEVYNYGSFKQSKMFAAGVTCSDCHEPHSGALRAPGDGVCLQCHAGSYASASHHRHEGGDPAGDLQRVPHAGAHLHGGGPAARPQLPDSAAGCFGQAWHAECLHRLPCRSNGAMGGGGD